MLISNRTSLPYECLGWIIDELGKKQVTIYYGKEDCVYIKVPEKYKDMYPDDTRIKVTIKYLQRYTKIIFSIAK